MANIFSQSCFRVFRVYFFGFLVILIFLCVVKYIKFLKIVVCLAQEDVLYINDISSLAFIILLTFVYISF